MNNNKKSLASTKLYFSWVSKFFDDTINSENIKAASPQLNLFKRAYHPF